MKSILAACGKYGGNQDRIKAFVLNMRYTGLRVGDAIRLSKSHVTDGKVFVRTAGRMGSSSQGFCEHPIQRARSNR